MFYVTGSKANLSPVTILAKSSAVGFNEANNIARRYVEDGKAIVAQVINKYTGQVCNTFMDTTPADA